MVYTANTPNPGDKISVTQPLILANFQDLDTYTQVDHVPLNDVDAGKHNQSHYLAQGAAGPAVAAGEGATYTKVGTDSKVDLFYKYQAGGSFDNVQQLLTVARAWGKALTGAAGDTKVAGSIFNVTSAAWNGSTTWTITTTKPFCASGDEAKVMVFVSMLDLGVGGIGSLAWTVTGTNTFTVRLSGNGSGISFMVMAL